MYLFPLLAGASAVVIGGYALVVARRDGDRGFKRAQTLARIYRTPVLPVPVLRALFYPGMALLIAFGVFMIGTGLSAW